MNLFLDTNILIDLVAKREPFVKWAIMIFKKQNSAEWKLYSSASSILTTYYIIEKHIGSKKALMAIGLLLNKLEIQPITKKHLLGGISSGFQDYEDAVQYQCAISCEVIDYIVTRNKNDFKQSSIKVISSEELF